MAVLIAGGGKFRSGLLMKFVLMKFVLMFSYEAAKDVVTCNIRLPISA